MAESISISFLSVSS